MKIRIPVYSCKTSDLCGQELTSEAISEHVIHNIFKGGMPLHAYACTLCTQSSFCATQYDSSFSKSSIPLNQLFYGNSDLMSLLALSPVLSQLQFWLQVIRNWTKERSGKYCSCSHHCCIVLCSPGTLTMKRNLQTYQPLFLLVIHQGSLWTKQATQTLVY